MFVFISTEVVYSLNQTFKLFDFQNITLFSKIRKGFIPL